MKTGTDLITFYNPEFWGVTSEDDIARLAEKDRSLFWTKILDTQAGTGVSGIELTFPPFDWKSATTAFGSKENLVQELRIRGLSIWSSFFADLDRIPLSEHRATEEKILTSVAEAAAFLSSVGGKVLVVGLPCRTTWLSEPVQFVDMALAQPMADLLNRMGAVTARAGVALALHTEANSVFCAPRDVDLFMLLTDPRYVSLCLDPAHITIEGGDPVKLLERHLERVVAMHWKDASGVMPISVEINETIYAQHRPYFRPIGQGSVNFAELATRLKKSPLKCGPILEMDSCANPEEALKDGVRFINTIYDGLEGASA